MFKKGPKKSFFFSVSLILFLIIFSLINAKISSIKITEMNEKLQAHKKNEVELNEELAALTVNYEDLFKEKNSYANDVLVEKANDLFSLVFEYDSSKKEDSIAKRKQAAAKIATDAAVNELFPADAAEGGSSVNTVSKLKKEPEVFVSAHSDDNISALVMIEYSVSIADSEDLSGNLMYKVSYNNLEKKITAIVNIGEVRIP